MRFRTDLLGAVLGCAALAAAGGAYAAKNWTAAGAPARQAVTE